MEFKLQGREQGERGNRESGYKEPRVLCEGVWSLFCVGSGKLLAEFKHRSDMIKIKFWKVNPGSR